MIAKKLVMASLLNIFLLTGFASTNDWNGTFTIKNYNGTTQTVIHTPYFVHYLFMHSDRCIAFRKGASINGLKLQDNIKLCTYLLVEEFTDEVQKMGFIVDKKIALGSTYRN